MKVAALALVLIVASAVVLIFANTLNSWVLGGLIGGLAALLISIPISLIIFASLARRQDERLYAQMLLQQEEDLAHQEEEQQEYYDDEESYDEYDEYGRVYETEAYYLPDDEDEYEVPRGRKQPEIRSLPAAGQSYASSSARAAAKQRALNNTQNTASFQPSRKSTRELAIDRERNERSSSRQNQQTGHQRTARTPYTTRSLRSQQQAAARRAAQQEATQGSQRSEQLSTGPVQRPATTRHLPPQSIQFNRARLQDERERRSIADEGGSQYGTNRGAKRPSNGVDGRPREMQTDSIRDRSLYPTTGQIHLNPETGQITRNRQLDEQYSGDEATTGNLRNPVVRRAPYLYEDDPLREELSQQIDKPITRRASRYLSFDEES
ncbi:MAG TPA: hypothetical protein VJO32_15375 [Ktedonobacteraceae bacterium]|nr:hypothetical protein [Ktedonobacteraceae bacterium]